MCPTETGALESALLLRAAVYATLRRFFARHGYVEVETPLRIPAPLPEAHIDAPPSGAWYLQPSPEAQMKRLLASGLPRIFQICKCFRQGERGRRHLPEMTMLEWYTAYQDYSHMMAQCEALICFVAEEIQSTNRIQYQGRTVDLRPPWPRLAVAQAFEAYSDMEMDQALAKGCFDEIMGLDIEPQLGWEQPLILYDYPAQCGALARFKDGRLDLVERFELYIGGLELCNAFSELTDVREQTRRFEREAALRRALGKPAYPSAEAFLKALPDMPQATGNALGIDRLLMLLADTDTIDDVVAFVPEDL
jgi:lysyl-tRNA synthetase class 2